MRIKGRRERNKEGFFTGAGEVMRGNYHAARAFTRTPGRI
jgi:hypothetical protein